MEDKKIVQEFLQSIFSEDEMQIVQLISENVPDEVLEILIAKEEPK